MLAIDVHSGFLSFCPVTGSGIFRGGKGIWESTRTLWTSSSFCFTASSCTSLMSQCYQLLISSLLGKVNVKHDLRQVSLSAWGSSGTACGEVQGFTLEALKPQQIRPHQPISNLLLEPRPFTLTWSQLMLKTSIMCKKLPLDLQIPGLRSQVPCQVSGEVVGRSKPWWWLLPLAIPLRYPQWPGTADFSTQYRPPELCEAVKGDKSPARGGYCHRLLSAEQLRRKRGGGTDFCSISRPLRHRKFSQNATTLT